MINATIIIILQLKRYAYVAKNGRRKFKTKPVTTYDVHKLCEIQLGINRQDLKRIKHLKKYNYRPKRVT